MNEELYTAGRAVILLAQRGKIRLLCELGLDDKDIEALRDYTRKLSKGELDSLFTTHSNVRFAALDLMQRYQLIQLLGGK